MKEFLTKNKDALKKPILYILVGLFVFYTGYISGNMENPITLALGLGCVTFGVRDIVVLALKEFDL
jgi:hypothetical protein